MTIQECPCGNDYDFHIAKIFEFINASKQDTDIFVTLDSFMLENRELLEKLVNNKTKIRSPTETEYEVKEWY